MIYLLCSHLKNSIPLGLSKMPKKCSAAVLPVGLSDELVLRVFVFVPFVGRVWARECVFNCFVLCQMCGKFHGILQLFVWIGLDCAWFYVPANTVWETVLAYRSKDSTNSIKIQIFY